MLFVEGPYAGDLDGRNAVFWAVLTGVPEGPSKRSRVWGLLKGASKATKKVGLFGNYLQKMLGAPRRSLTSVKCLESLSRTPTNYRGFVFSNSL